MTPRSSGPGGEYTPLRGTTNLRLTANQHCNVTENCAGVLAGTTSPANRVAAQLQTAWVTLGKQTLSTSRKRRSALESFSLVSIALRYTTDARRRFLMRFLPVALFLISTSMFAADNPFLGTWKLNTAKSKSSPMPVAQSMTVKFEADGDKVRRTVTGIDGEGKPIMQGGPAGSSIAWV